MAQARSAFLVALVSAALSACGCTSGAPVTGSIDAGPTEIDAHCDQDATLGFSACAFDTGPDARPGFLDAGPALPPIFPASSWIGQIAFLGTGPLGDVTIRLDARPTAGVVRGIFGGHGVSSTIELDVLEGGAWLVGRSPVDVITHDDDDCGGLGVQLPAPELRFVDQDGDGTFETLDGFGNYGLVSTLQDCCPPIPSDVLAEGPRPVVDDRPPTLELVPARPLVSAELLVIRASEPIDVSFAPRLVGPRTLALTPDLGSSAPARWTLDASAAPAGHYVLELGAPRDLAGLTAASVPAFEIDISPPEPPNVDGLDPAVLAVDAEGGTIVIGDDAGEIPLVGATSICGLGRTVVALDVRRVGHHQLGFTIRAELASGAVLSTIQPHYFLYDPDGHRIYHESFSVETGFPPGVPGMNESSNVFEQTLPFNAARAGRYTFVVIPEGRDFPTTCGSAAEPAVRGVTLDAITLR